MIKVSREDLLAQLEAVQPGLSTKDILEQSSCFVFRDGQVVTYNGKMACRVKSFLGKKLTGAVQSAPLLAILNKLSGDEVEVEEGEGELILRAPSGESSGITMEKEVLLPIDTIPLPDSWKETHKDFIEALSLVEPCAGNDASKPVTKCVHVHPKWVEAFDDFQIARYMIKTGIEQPTLVERNVLRNVLTLDVPEFGETEHWLHFRGPSGLVVSCLRTVEDFPDLTTWLALEGGEPTTLPKSLGDVAEKAEVFSKETDDNLVTVTLRPGKLRVKGQSDSGWYASAPKKVDYSGRRMSFLVAPRLLAKLVEEHSRCVVSPEKLRVENGKYSYVAVLQVPEGKNGNGE